MSSLNICKVLYIDSDTTVAGTIRSIGNIISTGSINGNTISIADNSNLGTITQISSELILSSTGNIVSIESDNLIFKNDNSVQTIAYTGLESTKNIHHSNYILNKNIIRQTTTILNVPSTTTAIVAFNGRMILYNMGTLAKGEVITGAFIWISTNTTCVVGLYPQVNPSLVISNITRISISAGINYVDFSSPYTIPTTQVYYLGTIIDGSGVTAPSTNNTVNHFHNYFIGLPGNVVTGKLMYNTQRSDVSFSNLPSSIQNIIFRPYLYNVFCGIYR